MVRKLYPCDTDDKDGEMFRTKDSTTRNDDIAENEIDTNEIRVVNSSCRLPTAVIPSIPVITI